MRTHYRLSIAGQRDNLSILSRSGRAVAHDDSRWRPPKEKNDRKRDWRISAGRAGPQYGLGEGSGAGRRPACTVSASCGCSSASTENFPIKGPEGQRAPSDHQCRSHGTRRAALGCAVKHTDHSRQCRAFVAPRRPATAASRRKNRPHRQHDHPPAGRPTARARVTRSSFASHEKPGKASHGCPCNTACATKS